MSGLTAAVLAALGIYVALMVGGQLPTDFSLFLFVCTIVSGVYYGADHLLFSRRRAAAAAAGLAEFDQRNRLALETNATAVAGDRSALAERLTQRPWWIEYTSGFFPVILAVFVLRSFLFEPFRIPSGSMIPTLQIGDLILVNKWQYGIRLPVINYKLIEIGNPQRGDVMVFRYPHQPSQDYIKRVVGLPGDVIEYRDRHLTINGDAVDLRETDKYFDPSRVQSYHQFIEKLGSVEHRVIFTDGPAVPIYPAAQHTDLQACVYAAGSVSCKVPPGSYFMMGDNRDNSEDSRFWGFVPDRNIVGRAFFIWMNFGNLGRIGSFR
jgi:signal peptidase I